MSVVGFTNFLMNYSVDYKIAFFWSKMSSISNLSIGLLGCFCLLFSEKFNGLTKKLILLLILIPNLFFFYIDLTTNLITEGIVRYDWDWRHLLQKNSIYYNIYMIWFFILLIFCLYLCISKYFNISDFRVKKQAELISFGIIFSIISFLIFDSIIPFYINSFPEFGVINFIICSIFIFVAIHRYKLFNIKLRSFTNKIFSNLTDFLILIDNNFKILEINQAVLNTFAYKQGELINKSLDNLFSIENGSKKDFIKNINRLNKNNPSISDLNINFATKESKTITTSVAISIAFDEFDIIRGFLIIGRDISERVKLLDNILRQSRYKTEFMAHISHELRTPLNIIIGFTDLLLERCYGDLSMNQADFVKDIKNSSEHLLDLIDKIINLSKIEAGEFSIKIKELNLNSFLSELIIGIKPLLDEKKLEFELIGLNSEKNMFSDPLRLKQILYNLLTNSIKYTIKGKITLKVKENNEYWKFEVIDTGIGIAKEDYPLVFQEFKRVNSEYVRSTQGTGLGLSLVKRILTLMRGEIYFYSELEKGSTFIFTLPKN